MSILDGALAFTMRHGLDNLTMKKLAVDLGVSEPAFYYHYKDREAIALAVVDHILEEVLLLTPAPSDIWQKTLWDTGDAYASGLVKYPHTATYLNKYATVLPSAALGVERLTGILTAAGFTYEQSVFAMETMFTFLTSTIEKHEIFSFDRTAHRRSQADWERMVPSSMKKFETVTFKRSVLGRVDYGLKIVIQGLEVQLEQQLGRRVERYSENLKVRR